MAKNDESLEALLDFLKKNPDVIKQIVVHPEKIPKLLARSPVPFATDRFLKYLSKTADGYPIICCGGGTKWLCAKGTKYPLPPPN